MTSHSSPDPIYTLRGAQSPITYLKFHKEHLYSGTQDGEVLIWDMAIRRILVTLDAHPGQSVIWIQFTISGKMITFGRDGNVIIWNKQEDEWKITDKISTGAIGFCPGCLGTGTENRELLIVPTLNTSVCDIYDIATLSKVGDLVPRVQKFGFVMFITFCFSEKVILIGYENGCVAAWDISKQEIVNTVKFFEDSLMCIDYDDEVNKGFCASVSNKISSWSMQNQHIVMGTSIEVTNPGFNQIRIRGDQRIFGTGGWDSRVRIFSVKKLQPLAVLSYHKESVQCLDFSSDNTLACGSKDHHISLWKIY